MIPLSLYIHIPWCVRKCPYCDFNSHEAREIPEEAYVDMLLTDLETHVGDAGGREIQSIFIGGGTPSLFSSRAITRLMNGVGNLLALADAIEITMEANPGTLNEGTMLSTSQAASEDAVTRFSRYREAGINRVSLGVQSFNASQLQNLGRIHSVDDAFEAFYSLRSAGISNINIDLMHGLPGQGVKDSLADLSRAIDLRPEHISWYQLTIEPNTVFYKRPPVLPDEDILWDIYESGSGKLDSDGYGRYEISAFAKVGFRSKHNLNYWEFGDYLGIGAGAHGKLTARGQIHRTAKTRLPADYLIAPKAIRNEVPSDELPLEFLMNALRLVDGFPEPLFETRTGLDREAITPFLNDAFQRGLLERDGDQIKPTALGINHLNDLLARVPDNLIQRG